MFEPLGGSTNKCMLHHKKHKSRNQNIHEKTSKEQKQKKKPKEIIMRQNSQSAIEFILCWHLLLGIGPAFKCGLYTQWDSNTDNSLPFAGSCQLELTSALGMGVHAQLPPQSWTPFYFFLISCKKSEGKHDYYSFVGWTY